MIRRLPIAMGIVAVAVLLGAAAVLPPAVAFFAAALPVILFPGVAVVKLAGGSSVDCSNPVERLAMWFVVGMGVLALTGLAGLAAHVRLSLVGLAVLTIYIVLIAVLVVRGRRRVPGAVRAAGSPRRDAIGLTLLLVGIAVGTGLVTLLTPRGYDDWYYLAYIKDFVTGKPLGAEDAIFNMGAPAPSRIWFGGGWWVLEALISRLSGVDPVACHQVYFPLLLVPFSVFSVFMLARRIFRSAHLALLGCCAQVLFYLSSAFPYRSAGWIVLCRIAQDKAVACFVVVPVVAALGIGLIDRRDGTSWRKPGAGYSLYWWTVITSVLVHGMGPVWCGLIMVPAGIGELLHRRDRGAMRKLMLAVLPLVVCGLILVSVQGVVKDFIRGPEPARRLEPQTVPVTDVLSSIYLPGEEFGPPTETHNPTAWILDRRLLILHPLFVVRYPMAIAGLVMTIVLIARVRSSAPARLLLSITVFVLLLTFTPPGYAIMAGLMTWRIVFRLTWVLPWGLTLAYFLARLKARPAAWLALLAVALALGRGNPANYAGSPLKMRSRNRPTPDAEAAFAYLTAKPSPQGVILASEVTGRMVPAFLPDGYLVNFREFGPVGPEDLNAIVRKSKIDDSLATIITEHDVRYILLEKDLPLAGALTQDAGYALEYENAAYRIWQVLHQPHPGARQGRATAED